VVVVHACDGVGDIYGLVELFGGRSVVSGGHTWREIKLPRTPC